MSYHAIVPGDFMDKLRLPPELFVRIIKFLSESDRAQVARVCRDLRVLVDRLPRVSLVPQSLLAQRAYFPAVISNYQKISRLLPSKENNIDSLFMSSVTRDDYCTLAVSLGNIFLAQSAAVKFILAVLYRRLFSETAQQHFIDALRGQFQHHYRDQLSPINLPLATDVPDTDSHQIIMNLGSTRGQALAGDLVFIAMVVHHFVLAEKSEADAERVEVHADKSREETLSSPMVECALRDSGPAIGLAVAMVCQSPRRECVETDVIDKNKEAVPHEDSPLCVRPRK
ncbi:MAG: hypothetical protein CMF50_01595 [Legionellales bacterium]|nr:hypothetical protein [Legionellales bacterium]